jgi:hypothetical protein
MQTNSDSPVKNLKPPSPEGEPPASPAYEPASPEGEPPASPAYEPASPAYAPSSPAYEPVEPVKPVKPVKPAAPVAPATPVVPQFTPLPFQVDEVMSEFYAMKKQYEEKYHEKYLQPILKDVSKSKKEKKMEFSKLPKPECISCNRNVGTIFTVNHYDDGFRRFVAKCGDFANPCKLDIHFQVADRNTYEKLIEGELDSLNEVKKKIIEQKNKVMFGYIALREFDSLVEELKQITEMAGFFIESNVLKNDNPERENLLARLEDEFGRELIQPFKQMLSNFTSTNNEQLVTKAVEMYKNEILPKLKDIQQLKYHVNFVDFDPSSKQYFLLQRKNTLESLETGILSDDAVYGFVKGGLEVEEKKTKKSKTQKNTEGKSKAKTRKLKPTIIVEEEVEEEQRSQEEPEEQNEEE